MVYVINTQNLTSSSDSLRELMDLYRKDMVKEIRDHKIDFIFGIENDPDLFNFHLPIKIE